MSDCPLCRAEPLTARYHECERCWVARCVTCDDVLVVWKRHGTDPPDDDRQHMLDQLDRHTGDGYQHDLRRQSIPDHWHAHARVAFTSTDDPEPIGQSMTGWRIDWLDASGTLRPAFHPDLHLAGRYIDASCQNSHTPPDAHCSCGIYGAADADTLVAEFAPKSLDEGPFSTTGALWQFAAALVPVNLQRWFSLVRVELKPPIRPWTEPRRIPGTTIAGSDRNTTYRGAAARIDLILSTCPYRQILEDAQGLYRCPTAYVGRHLSPRLVRDLVEHGGPDRSPGVPLPVQASNDR